MNNLLVSSREADIAYLESINEIEMFGDSAYIDDVFTEAGGDQKSLGTVIVEKIQALAEKIQKFFTDLFDRIRSNSLKSKAEAIPKNKALAAKKVQGLDQKKIAGFSKKYKERIKNAKSVEELDQIVAEYNKKKKIGFGVGATVSVAVGVLCTKVLVPKYKEENVKYVESLRQEMETAKKESDSIFDNYAKAYGSDLASKNEKVQAAKASYEKSARIYHGNENDKTMNKMDLAKKRLHVMGMVISDELHAAKDCASSKFTALTDFVKDTWHNISEEDAKLILAAKKLTKNKEENN